MSCVSTKYTEDQIRDALLAKKIQDIVKAETVEEKAKIMLQTNKMVSTQEVSASELTAKKRRELGVEKSDTVARYVVELPNKAKKLLAKGRTSDKSSESFIKSVGGVLKAKEINQLPDSVLKATMGTRIHEINQRLFYNLIESQDENSNIRTLSSLGDKPNMLSEARVRAIANLTLPQFNLLKTGMESIMNTIKETQKRIDPDGKAIILPEQFIYNPVTDTGSTIDLLVMFSDGSHGNIDYKSISANQDKMQKVGDKYNLIDTNWIPKVKRKTFEGQLTQSNRTMETIYGSSGAVLSRIIPIHVKYKNKAGVTVEGNKLEEKIEFLNIGYRKKRTVEEGGVERTVKEWMDNALAHIPIAERVKLDDPKMEKILRESISTFTQIINNRQIRIKSMDPRSLKHSRLILAVEENKKAVQKVILDQDFHYLIEGYTAIVNRIAKDGRLISLDNINSPEINGKENPNYMTTLELIEFIQELQAFNNIVSMSVHFQAELAISEDDAAFTDYKQNVNNLFANTDRLIKELNEIKFEREINPEQREAFEDVREVGWWQRMFNTLGEQDAIPFRMLREKLNKAQSQTTLNIQTLFDKLTNPETGMNKKLGDLAKKLGKSLGDVYDMLIDEKTENLHSRYSSDFWEDFAKKRFEKDKVWLKKHLTLKADAKELYKSNRDMYVSSGYKLTQKEIKNWERLNSFENVIASNKWWLYYDLNPNMEDNYHSEGFKMMKKTPELMEYWEFYTETMGELNNLLGLRGDERRPDNFLAYIRQDLKDIIGQGTFNSEHILEAVRSIYEIREDDSEFGSMTEDGTTNPVTGELKSEIPRYFINPIKDNKGRIMKGMKMRDISKSLLTYAGVAYNYHYMKTEVEPHVEAIRDYLVEKGIQHVNDKGVKKKWLSGEWAKKKGDNNPVVDMYDKYVKYHLYGVKIQNATKQQVKWLQTAKGYQADKELALAPLLWIGNFIQITGNAFFEGHGGYYYKKKDMWSSIWETSGASGKEAYMKNQALGYLFEFYPGAMDIRKKNMSARFVEKWINRDSAHIGMRKAEQVTNNNIGISILKQHAFIDGKMVRLETAPKGTKSIFENSTYKDGKLIVDGLTDKDGKVINHEDYTKIREYGVSIVSRIKGQMNPNDLAAIHMSIEGAAFMGFKTWLPGMAEARFGKLRYNQQTDSLVNGMYSALAAQMSREDRDLFSWLGNVVAPTLLKFSVNMATFGGYNFVAGQFGEKYKFKVNEQRAQRYFEAYKEKFKHDAEIQRLTFDEFLAYQQSQLRRLAAEVSAILAITASVIAMRGDWDDDGVADWKKSWTTRTLYRAMNRGRRELAFFINPGEWESFFRMPVPVMTLPIDAYTALSDALSGVGDILTGEPPVRPSGKSKFYELFKFTPGYKLPLMFEAVNEESAKLREI